MSSEFSGLFGDNEALNQTMNVFFNENWKELFVALKPSIEASFANVIKEIINNVFALTPYKDLFKQK